MHRAERAALKDAFAARVAEIRRGAEGQKPAERPADAQTPPAPKTETTAAKTETPVPKTEIPVPNTETNVRGSETAEPKRSEVRRAVIDEGRRSVMASPNAKSYSTGKAGMEKVVYTPKDGGKPFTVGRNAFEHSLRGANAEDNAVVGRHLGEALDASTPVGERSENATFRIAPVRVNGEDAHVLFTVVDGKMTDFDVLKGYNTKKNPEGMMSEVGVADAAKAFEVRADSIANLDRAWQERFKPGLVEHAKRKGGSLKFTAEARAPEAPAAPVAKEKPARAAAPETPPQGGAPLKDAVERLRKVRADKASTPESVAEADAAVEAARAPDRPFDPPRPRPDAKAAAKVVGEFAGKDKDRPSLHGTYHDKANGVVVATDGSVLIATRHGFDPNAADREYPDWKRVVPADKDLTRRTTVNPSALAKACAEAVHLTRATGAKDPDYNRAKVALRIGDRVEVFDAELLGKVARAMEANGITEIRATGKGDSAVAVAKNGDTTIALMPLRRDIDGTIDGILGKAGRHADNQAIVISGESGRVLSAPERTDVDLLGREHLEATKTGRAARHRENVDFAKGTQVYGMIARARTSGETDAAKVYGPRWGKLSAESREAFEKALRAKTDAEALDVLADYRDAISPKSAETRRNEDLAIKRAERRIAAEDALESLVMRRADAEAYLGRKSEGAPKPPPEPPKPPKRLDPKAGGSSRAAAGAVEAAKPSAPSRAEAVAATRTLGVDAGLPDAQLKAKMREWERHADDPRVAARLKAAKAIMADRAAKGKADPRAAETLKALAPDGAAEGTTDIRVNPRLAEDVARLTNIDRTKGDVARRGEVVEFSDTPKVLRLVGMPEARIISRADILRKVKDKHRLSDEDIASLPNAYSKPAAIFRDGNNYVVLTDMMAKTYAGVMKPVMVYLRAAGTSEKRNFIASAYAREPASESAYADWAKRGNLLYLDKEKAARLNLEEETDSQLKPQGRSGSIKTPEDVSTDISVGSVPKSAVDVNGGGGRLDMARLDPKRRSDPKVLAWARKQGRTVADGKVTPDAVREYDAQQAKSAAKAAKNWFPDLKTVYHDYGEGVERGQHVIDMRDTAGKTFGWFDPAKKEVHLLPGADAKTVAHEVMWHGTRDWAKRAAAQGDARAAEHDRADGLLEGLAEAGLRDELAELGLMSAARGGTPDGVRLERLRDGSRSARSAEEARDVLRAAGVIGRSLTNEGLGLTVVISNRDVAKMTSEKAVKKSVSPRLHTLAVANADKVFEAAFVDGTHADTHGRKEVRRTHRLGSAVYDPASGRFEPVLVTVLEYVKDGTKMYTVEAIDVAKYENSAGQLAAVTVGERQAPIAEFVKSIANRVAEVNGGAAKFSVARGEDALKEMRPVETRRVASSYAEARTALAPQVGKTFRNKETGVEATLSNNSVNKLLSGKAVAKSVGVKEHLAAVANVTDLFENGRLLATDEGARKGVLSAKRFFSRFRYNGEDLIAKTTVLEYERGDHRIYSVEAMEVEKAGSILAPKGSTNQAENPALPSTPYIVPQSGPSAQGGAKLEAGGGSGRGRLAGAFALDPRAEVLPGGVRVAADAGRGERTPGGLASSRELSSQGTTPLTAAGRVHPMALPVSEMVWLYRELTGSAVPPRVARRLPGGAAASHTRAGGLSISADVFGIVDRTDAAREKARLKEHGFYRDEDADWCASQTPAAVRAERARSDGQLGEQLRLLGERRVRGEEAGGQAAARGVFAHELAKVVMEMPRTGAGVVGRVQKIGDAVRREVAATARANGADAEGEMRGAAGTFLDWANGGPLADPETGARVGRGQSLSLRELTDGMFGAFLTMPQEMRRRAPAWYDAIARAISSDARLSAAFRELSLRGVTGRAHEAVAAEIRRSMSRATAARLAELERAANEPIPAGSALDDAKETGLVALHDRMAPVVVRIDAKAKVLLKAKREALAARQ